MELNEDTFLLRSLTKACRLKNDTVRICLPITKNVLLLLLSAAEEVFAQQPYLRILYRALFTTAYFGLFRIGKLSHSPHVLKAINVHVGINKKKLLFMLITSKTHGMGDKPQIIKISGTVCEDAVASNTNFTDLCPFTVLQQYLECRPLWRDFSEQFFIFKDRSPLLQSHFCNTLTELLNRAGLDSSMYGSHGFHAGCAVDMFYVLKLDIGMIRKIGRWKSNAVYHYLAY